METDSPVFIVGCGRSGTTYLRSIVQSSGEVFIPPESRFLTDYLHYAKKIRFQILSYFFFREPQLKTWNETEYFTRSTIEKAIEHIHVEEARRRGARRWGQKTPRFVHSFSLFERFYKGIQWICIYRDPRAVVSSMRRSKRHTYSVLSAIKRWKRDNAVIINEMKNRTRSNMLFIKYEDLITQFDSVSEKITAFLNLQRTITINDLRNRKRPQKEFQNQRLKHNAVRNTFIPDSRFIDAWKQHLSDADIAFIEKQCAGEMDYFGYKRISTGTVDGPTYVIKDCLRSLSNVSIPAIYLFHWPELIMWTLMRKICFRFLSYEKIS